MRITCMHELKKNLLATCDHFYRKVWASTFSCESALNLKEALLLTQADLPFVFQTGEGGGGKQLSAAYKA